MLRIAYVGHAARDLEQALDACEVALAQGADALALDLRRAADPLALLGAALARHGGRAGLVIGLEPGPRAIDLERRVVPLLREHGLGDGAGGVVVQSSDVGVVKRLGGLAPELPRHQRLDPVASGQAAWLLPGIAAYATGITPWHGVVDATLVAAARGAGLAIYAHVVDDPRDIVRVAASGVDGIVTRVPDVLAAALAEPAVLSIAGPPAEALAPPVAA